MLLMKLVSSTSKVSPSIASSLTNAARSWVQSLAVASGISLLYRSSGAVLAVIFVSKKITSLERCRAWISTI